MSTVSLKNIKKIYPFSGDDIKNNKKKKKNEAASDEPKAKLQT